MPSAFPATVAEREAELIALQSAFDEYIASSRELEDELDAELAKMRTFATSIVGSVFVLESLVESWRSPVPFLFWPFNSVVIMTFLT